MVIKVNKKVEVIKMETPLKLPENLQNEIENFWKKQLKENPHLFNGEIWSVTKYEELPDKIQMSIQKTNYAHYLYEERVGIDKKYACYNISSGILLETKDGYYIIGEMNETTSYPRGLQIPAGNLDENDIRPDGQVDIINNVARELKEEIDIDLFDKSIVEKYVIQYLEMPPGQRNSYSLIMKGTVSITAKQMEEHYNKYKTELEQNSEEVEFARLHFIKKEDALETLRKLDNPKRPYLEDTIALDSKIKEDVLSR